MNTLKLWIKRSSPIFDFLGHVACRVTPDIKQFQCALNILIQLGSNPVTRNNKCRSDHGPVMERTEHAMANST